jgi:serine/threonine-protein kinase
MSETSSHQSAQRAEGSSLYPASADGPLGSTPGSASGRAESGDGLTVISARPPVSDLPYAGGIPSEAVRQWEGEQLGQFTLQKFVGGGGMGIVFRAHDTTLDREVAVKVLSRDQSADEETLRRFRNEAQSAARLNHDNIARVFYVGEDRGVHYIVFEFIDGINIRDLVEREGPLPLNQALSYTYQIALALDHASQRSVIHRDIKPSNVLVTPHGKAKLVDMGLARLNLLAPANDLTASGVTLGTFDYISPEQARDPRSADVRSDLYSLGCSFYFMLTGRPPFPEGTVLQKLLQHQGDTPPNPRSVRPDLPQQVSRVLDRLLAKTPAERYQQPLELIEELAQLGQFLGIPLGEVPPPRSALQPIRPQWPWQRHLPWMVPIATLLLVVLGLDIYGSNTPPPPAPSWSVNSTIVAPAPGPNAQPAETKTSPAGPVGGRAPQSTASPRAVSSSGSSNDSFLPAKSPRSESPRPEFAGAETATSSGDAPISNSNAIGGMLDFLMKQAAEQKQAVGSPGENAELAGNLVDPAPSQYPPGDGQVLVVGDASLPNSFTSLLAACSAAKDGDVIELHYNGPRRERPLVLSNVQLTIRAGSGYRPTVVFSPEPDKPFADSQMVRVSGGQLLVKDIHWEFELPATSPTERSLFEAQQADLLDFENCTFTVRSQPPYYGGVVVFDVKSPPGTGTMNIGATGAMGGQLVKIQLENCVARGEATMLRVNDLQAVRLTWNNGLLAVSDRLLVCEGASLEPRRETAVELVLRHLTAMVGGGLVLMTNSDEDPYQVVVDVRASDSIIATTGSAPLIEQRGSAGVEEFQARFRWSADSVYFHGFNSFWQIMNSAGPGGARQLSFDEWQAWSRFTSRDQFSGPGAVVWSAPPPTNRPFHAHLASDYALNSSSAAVRGASDGGDAGGPLPYLPTLTTTHSQGERSEPTRSNSTPTATGPMAVPMPMPAEPIRMPPDPMIMPEIDD